MRKIIFVAFIVLLLSLSLVNAITQQEINEAKSLIDSKADCKNLSNSQLEIIGEYYMEQMMPGISHERAHEMMGLKEGSEAEEQFHINMAKRSYCGENTGMMSGGMIGNNYQAPQNNNSYQDPYKNNFSIFQIFFYIMLTLVVVILILVIILLINKSKNNTRQRRGK